jgi:peptide/nickel transport system ATP-binding protein/oligopeptide transport system ATP-binding protein
MSTPTATVDAEVDSAPTSSSRSTNGYQVKDKSKSNVLLEVDHLVKYFPVRGGFLQRTVAQVKAVDDVSFFIRQGETLGLVGESGCGKTTVGRTLLGLIPATGGRVRFEGNDVFGQGVTERAKSTAKLPRLALVAVALTFISALYYLIIFLLVTSNTITLSSNQGVNDISAWTFLGTAVLGAGLGIGLLRLQGWARTLLIVLSYITILLNLVTIATGSLSIYPVVGIVLSIAFLVLLYNENVADAFGVNYLKSMRRDIQIIFQDPFASLDPRVPIGESVGEGLLIHGFSKQERKDRVADVLAHVGLLPEHASRFPHEFSGGQRQRIGIARALALRPKFIVCDEPVSALDVSIQSQVLNILKDLQEEYGLTYLFIAHNLSVVEHISDRVGVMYLGKMAEMTDRYSLFENPQHPYTHALLSAIPIPDPKVKRERIILKGDVPSPLNPPTGCRFHTRCWLAQDICKQKVPEWRNVAPAGQVEHFVACHFAPFTKMPLPGETSSVAGKDETVVVKA